MSTVPPITDDEITALENAYREARVEFHSAETDEDARHAAWMASEIDRSAERAGVALDTSTLDAQAIDEVEADDDGYDY